MKRRWLLTAVCLWIGAATAFAEPALLGRLGQLKDSKSVPDEARLASILEKSVRFYESLKNYRAIFKKREKSEKNFGPEETIFFKFEKPFKIYMGWLNTAKKGLQVVYERGRHDGKLAIHQPGLFFGLAPVVFLDQKSPWVREGSESYNIEDAGIGTFLYDFSDAVVRAAAEKKLKVRFEDTAGPTAASRVVEVTFDGSSEHSGYFAWRVVVTFDPVTELPVRMELFDWQNEPIGVYSYENLQFDVPAEDAEFKKEINHYLYRVYSESK